MRFHNTFAKINILKWEIPTKAANIIALISIHPNLKYRSRALFKAVEGARHRLGDLEYA
jgi:hypothetical protein